MSQLRRQAALKPLPDDPASPEETVTESDSQGYGEADPPGRQRGTRGRKKKKEAATDKSVIVRIKIPIDTYMPLKRESIVTDTPISRLVCELIEKSYGGKG
ncbi:MAG: hypothetical protein OXI01_03410 [Albidovulum sp.]|nr:hypothetical protein [Albidovulum sp.]